MSKAKDMLMSGGEKDLPYPFRTTLSDFAFLATKDPRFKRQSQTMWDRAKAKFDITEEKTMPKAKDMLMSGLEGELHRRFAATLDALTFYRDAEQFRTELWKPESELHKILEQLGQLLVRTQTFSQTLPASADLNTFSAAIDQLEDDETEQSDDETPMSVQGVVT